MSVLFIAVPIALLIAGSGVIAFIWAARDGQLDDLETPPLRMLLDDEAPPPSPRPPGASWTNSPGAASSRSEREG